MNELQRKDKKVVLSAKALEAIYHTASSSVGKLILGKQYIGGYAMEQQCGRGGRKRIALQMTQEITNERNSNTFN